MIGDTRQYLTLSYLNRIYDKPLEERVIPFSAANLEKVETFSNFHSNLFRNIVSYSHNNFEIRILVEPFDKTEPSVFALETLGAESCERLFLQFMALYQVSTSLGLDFIDFSSGRIGRTGRTGQTDQTSLTTLQFPLDFNEKDKATTAWENLPGIFQKNRHFRDLNKNNLQEKYDRLKDKYLFDENQLYIYNYDDFASTILNTYPLSEPETNATVKIKINSLHDAPKKIIKLNLYNRHRSGEVFFANLENPSDHLPDSLAQILSLPGKPGFYGEDFVSIIHQLNLLVKTFSFTTVVLTIDRLRTKEDAEFIKYLLETPGLGSLVLLCFDPACRFIDFDLTLNEKPGNMLRKYLRFQGTGEPGEPGPPQPGEIELLKIFHTLPLPIARDRLEASFSPGQSALIGTLIQKNFLKVNAGNVFPGCSLSTPGIAITAAEEQSLLESLLTTPAAESLPVQIKYLLITDQDQRLKNLLKRLRDERIEIGTDLPVIKQLFSGKYLAPGKEIDIEVLELLVSILVEENELSSAKELILNFPGAHRAHPSVNLKLKMAHIYKREKEYAEMDRLLTEVEKEKSMPRGHRKGDMWEEYYYLRFVFHEKMSAVRLANRYLKMIEGELYKQRAAVILSDRSLYNRGDHKNTEILLEQAVDYFHRHRYPVDEIEARSQLAKLLREKQAFKEAEKSYQNLFIKSEMKNYRLLSASIAVDLGNLYLGRDKFSLAETWYKKGLKIFQTQENPAGIFLAKSNLVEINKIKGHWRESKNQLESILEYDRQKNTPAALAIDYLNIAHLEYLRHRYPEARGFIAMARPLFEKNNRWDGIIECEVLDLKIALTGFFPQKPGKVDLSFFRRQWERLGKDQKILVSIVEIAENDSLKNKTNLIIEKLDQFHLKTSRFEIAALLLNRYQSPALLELLKSLSTELSQENKNYYYYEYFYLYYLHFCDLKEIQEKEKERFNEVCYFFQGNQRDLDPVIQKYKHALDENDTRYDVFKSAELVGDYMQWKIPEDAFNSLVKALHKLAAVDLVRLAIYESINNTGPWIDFSYPLPGAGGHPFDALTREMIRRTITSLENQDLAMEDVKQQYQADDKAFYFFKKTDVIYWKISEVLYGALILAFSTDQYGEYDFYSRLRETLKKYASLIQRYYETDFKLNQKLDFIIGQSPVVKLLKEEILKISKVDFPVLIRGESGSGKELVAKAIHLLGSRAGNLFVPVNAAAIPEGLLEAELFGYKKGAFTGANENKPGLIETAHNGTLFLDEIADLPLNLQAKLLRVLQENEIRRLGENKTQLVNIRLVCATNKDLKQMAAENRFREDLYFRIEVLTIQVPPLRERLEDIPLLVRHFFKKNSFTIPDPGELQAIFLHYQSQPWTGNIRELESSVKRLITYYPDIDKELGENRQRRTFPPESGLIEAREKLEKTMVIEALRDNHWNKVETAAALKITRQHLFGLFKKYGIKEELG